MHAATKRWPTARRWAPTASMMLMSWLSYLDRNVLALLSPSILHDTGLTAEDYGWIVSAFSVAYLVGNPLWGRLLDRFGVRASATWAVFVWSLASVAHAFASGAFGFAAARALLGFGEGATFPSGLRTATQTLEEGERARGIALAYSGGSLGAIAAPLLITPVALHWGWRGAFLGTGAVGLAWLVLWRWVSRRAELGAPVRATGPFEGEAGDDAPPAIGERPVLAFMAAYALGGLPLGFVLYGAPIHLARGLGYSQAMLGRVLWLPPLGWELGYFFWGAVLDRAARRGTLGPKTFGTIMPWLTAMMLPLAFAGEVRSLPLLLSLLFFAMFVAAGFVIVPLAEVTRRFSRAHGGFLAGLGAGAWSGVMAVAMPIFGGLFERGAYGVAYPLAAGGPLVALAIWGWLRRG